VKVRVHELAKELGVASKVIMAKLAEMDESVRSASSPLEPPVATRIRACFGTPSARPDQQRMPPREYPGASQLRTAPVRHTVGSSPPPRAPSRRPRREFYRGEPPQGFNRWLLDRHVVPQRQWAGLEPPSGYFEDEVDQAKELAAFWAPALLQGLDCPSILASIQCESPINPDQAVQLHDASIHPREVGWSYEDRENGTLAHRLTIGRMTITEVIQEVRYRREQRS